MKFFNRNKPKTFSAVVVGEDGTQVPFEVQSVWEWEHVYPDRIEIDLFAEFTQKMKVARYIFSDGRGNVSVVVEKNKTTLSPGDSLGLKYTTDAGRWDI